MGDKKLIWASCDFKNNTKITGVLNDRDKVMCEIKGYCRGGVKAAHQIKLL